MTSEEVIAKLEEIKNDKIAEAAMDSDYANLSIYDDVFNAAIEALQSPQAKQESAMLLAGHLAETILKTAADIVKEELSDKQLYFKIYCDSEPNEIAEKIYQLCDSREKLIEVWKRIGEYIESENEQAISALDPCVKYVDRDKLISAICEKYCEHERNGELYFDACRIKQDLANLIVDFPSVMLKTESEETTNE